MTGATDWERGVLAAAEWMKKRGLEASAQAMLREIPSDDEGTEGRVVKQIAQYTREAARSYGDLYGQICEKLADDIERGDWRLP